MHVIEYQIKTMIVKKSWYWLINVNNMQFKFKLSLTLNYACPRDWLLEKTLIVRLNQIICNLNLNYH